MILIQPRKTRNARKIKALHHAPVPCIPCTPWFISFLSALSELLPARALHADAVVEIVSQNCVDVLAGADCLVVDAAA